MAEKMTSDKIDEINDAINTALADISKEFDVSISFGNISYDDTMFYSKMTVLINGADSKEVRAYKQNYKFHGLPELGTTFTDHGRTYTITGFNTRARKNKILIRRDDNENFHCSIDMIKRFAI
jgi:hypothetical protein